MIGSSCAMLWNGRNNGQSKYLRNSLIEWNHWNFKWVQDWKSPGIFSLSKSALEEAFQLKLWLTCTANFVPGCVTTARAISKADTAVLNEIGGLFWVLLCLTVCLGYTNASFFYLFKACALKSCQNNKHIILETKKIEHGNQKTKWTTDNQSRLRPSLRNHCCLLWSKYNDGKTEYLHLIKY